MSRGICSKGTLFRCATSRSASFSISSDTCTPRRVARWTWISCRISRSSTCWRITSSGGGVPWPLRRSAMRAVCVSSWLCRTMPSLTTATTRSRATPLADMSRVCARAAPAASRLHSKPVRIRLMIVPRSGVGGVGGGGVSTNAALQESVAAGSDRGQPREFHLEQDGIVALAGAVRNIVPAQQAQPPAAAGVFEAGEAVDRLVLLRRVHLPREELPARRQPPGESGVPLLEQPFAIAVPEVDEGVSRGPVLDARVAAQGVGFLGVPFHGDARAPVAPGGQLDLADQIRRITLLRHFARQHDARTLEVETLADSGRQVLLAALRAEQACRKSRGQLVGVAETVGADIAVGAEELHEVQVRQRRVEHRQVVLVAERNPGVAQARLERLDELLVLAGLALEHQPAVEREDRRRAGGRFVLAGRRVRQLVRG